MSLIAQTTNLKSQGSHYSQKQQVFIANQNNFLTLHTKYATVLEFGCDHNISFIFGRILV